jgi:hypothetical protein
MPDEVVDAVRAHTSALAAMIVLLVEKGFFTEGEFQAMELRMTARLDQESAKWREEMMAKLDPLEKMLVETGMVSPAMFGKGDGS